MPENSRVSKIFRNPGTWVFLVLFLFTGAIWIVPKINFEVCPKKFNSEHEVREAVGAFFRSGNKRSRDLIQLFRTLGATEEYLAYLRDNCRFCYVQKGIKGTELDQWFASITLVPERHFSFRLRVDCANAVDWDT
jgi:hypothetical protein